MSLITQAQWNPYNSDPELVQIMEITNYWGYKLKKITLPTSKFVRISRKHEYRDSIVSNWVAMNKAHMENMRVG